MNFNSDDPKLNSLNKNELANAQIARPVIAKNSLILTASRKVLLAMTNVRLSDQANLSFSLVTFSHSPLSTVLKTTLLNFDGEWTFSAALLSQKLPVVFSHQ